VFLFNLHWADNGFLLGLGIKSLQVFLIHYKSYLKFIVLLFFSIIHIFISLSLLEHEKGYFNLKLLKFKGLGFGSCVLVKEILTHTSYRVASNNSKINVLNIKYLCS